MIPIEQLQRLLPHSGEMCLLNEVSRWDETLIECRALSHCLLSNPLREGDQLPVHAGIEYAAQAMAIHGSLCADQQAEPRRGYLAVLSRVDWKVERLDQFDEALTVTAEKLMALADGSSYAFRLYCRQQLLIEGQAVVALQP